MKYKILTVLVALVVLPLNLNAECTSRKNSSDLSLEALAELDYKELLNFDLRVTSPSKKSQKYSEVASSLYVLTNEDIRRSGAKHIADVLRLVPGLNVAQINNNQWAVSSRGFNQRFSDKLLVLVDGQVVFTPGFNGVFWEQLGLILEDVDRVEVIKGPGAALWGSNAVNGVINIITCSGDETQGTKLSASSGSEEDGSGFVRHGGTIGDSSTYRLYANHRSRDGNVLEMGGPADDEFNLTTAGVRVDSNLSENDKLFNKFESFYLDHDEVATVPSIEPPYVDDEAFSGRRRQYGTNMISRWNHNFSSHSELQTQVDYLFEKQDGKAPPITRHTFHIDVQHHYSGVKNHDFVYGFESRFYEDKIEGSFADDFDPERRGTDLHTFFINDEITLIEDTLNLILGTKLEHNVHTGFEFMPNIRTVWTPNSNQTVWAAVSRAVSDPSRTFEDVIVPLAAFPDDETGLPVLASLYGSRDLESVNLNSYEIGYRGKLFNKVLLDVSLFYNDYDDVTSAEPSEAFFGALKGQSEPSIILPITFENNIEAESYGTEVAIEYRPYDWWKLAAGYAFINLNVDTKDSADFFDEKSFIEGSTPQHTLSVRSLIDVTENIDFDSVIRYVDSLSVRNVDSYFELDLRLAWEAMKGLEFAIVGKNLLHDSHKEFEEQLLAPPATEIERAVYGTVSYSF